MESAEILVLKKFPYKETSLIVSGISPDDGRIDFVMKGAQKLGKKKFPVVDVFREVRIDFNPVREGMPSVYSAELLNSFDEISGNADNYMLACELGKFVLNNSAPELPCPEVYGAMNHLLAVLGGYVDLTMTPVQCRLLLKLAYLNENGLLPGQLSPDPQKDQLQHRLMAILLEAAQGDLPLPQLADDYWAQLENWASQLCQYHGLKLN